MTLSCPVSFTDRLSRAGRVTDPVNPGRLDLSVGICPCAVGSRPLHPRLHPHLAVDSHLDPRRRRLLHCRCFLTHLAGHDSQAS